MALEAGLGELGGIFREMVRSRGGIQNVEFPLLRMLLFR